MEIRSSFPILYVASVARALAFYGDVLGLEVVYTFPPGDDPGFASLRVIGSTDKIGLSANTYDPGHGLPMQNVDARPFELCLEVPDVDAAVHELGQSGVPIIAPGADQPWGERVAFVTDPDGNPVHLRGPMVT